MKEKYIVYGNGELGKKYIMQHPDDDIICILDRKVPYGEVEYYSGYSLYNPEEYYSKKCGEHRTIIAIADYKPIVLYLEKLGLIFYKDFVPYNYESDKSDYAEKIGLIIPDDYQPETFNISYKTHEQLIYPCVLKAIGMNREVFYNRKHDSGDYFHARNETLSYKEYLYMYYDKWHEFNQ